MAGRVTAAVAICCSLATLSVWADVPWWDDFPLIYQGEPAQASPHNASISFNGLHNAPGWGTYTLAFSDSSPVNQLHAEGIKSISYYETFGQAMCYIAELIPAEQPPLMLNASHWSWQYYSGGPITWVGAHAFYDDEYWACPYTRTHPDYGSAPMTYPDGTVATGYNGDSSDPRNSRVYDAACSKDILGGITCDVSPVSDYVQANGPHNGLLLIGGQYCGIVSFSKDSACPGWLGLDSACARLAASRGMDGMWTDNFSPWDSFNAGPVRAAFGDWSVALFRNYLAAHFTPEELVAMGVADTATFDVRAALRAQVVAWGGNDADLNHWVWRDARWLDHPLWRAYEIFKRQKGTEALTAYYEGVKQAAREAGVDEFLVAGNDIPAFSLGWVRNNLDMVSTETNAWWSLDGGPRGFMLPPAGRMSPQYKLAREHAKSRFVNVWFYLSGPYEQYRSHPELARALHYEMLANHTLPLGYQDYPTVAGTSEEVAEFFGFVKSTRPIYGERRPVEEIGIYYSSSSVLAFMTPGGVLDHSAQPHQFGHYGWGTALGNLHYQYRAVPEWKLTPETLASLRVLIIPNATVLEPEKVATVLVPWVEAGGRLIVTGDSGLRLGEDGNFDLNPSGLSLAPLTGVASMTPAPARQLSTHGQGKVLYIPGNVGFDYYVNEVDRAARLADFASTMDEVLAGASPLRFSATAAPASVGLVMYEDEAARHMFVDANNFNIDLGEDAMVPQGPFSFDVALPEWLNVPDLRVSAMSPDGAVPLSSARGESGRVSVTVDSLTHYAGIVFDFPDADGDTLSDATENGLGTNPASADTDSDGLSDGAELARDGNPYAFTPGADTDPLNPDTDGDHLSDGAEVAAGHNPLDPHDPPSPVPVSAWPAAPMLLVLGAAFAFRPARNRVRP